MKIQDLKKLVSQVGSVVLVDDSGVGLVVLSYEQYQSLLGIELPAPDIELAFGSPSHQNLVVEGSQGQVSKETRDGFQQPDNLGMGTAEREEVERLNREINLLKEEIKQRELQELAEETVVDEH